MSKKPFLQIYLHMNMSRILEAIKLKLHRLNKQNFKWLPEHKRHWFNILKITGKFIKWNIPETVANARLKCNTQPLLLIV